MIRDWCGRNGIEIPEQAASFDEDRQRRAGYVRAQGEGVIVATKEKTQGNRESKSQPSKDEALSPIRDGYLIDFISGKPVKDGPSLCPRPGHYRRN